MSLSKNSAYNKVDLINADELFRHWGTILTHDDSKNFYDSDEGTSQYDLVDELLEMDLDDNCDTESQSSESSKYSVESIASDEELDGNLFNVFIKTIQSGYDKDPENSHLYKIINRYFVQFPGVISDFQKTKTIGEFKILINKCDITNWCFKK